MTLTVLVNAGPWLPVPPSSYGGVENMLAYLIPELRRAGHRVLLATVGESGIEVDDRTWTFQEGQLKQIAAPYSEVVGIAQAHMRDVIETIARRGDEIDVVHDVLEVVGPSMLSVLGPDSPPVLHTLQWDLHNHPNFYQGFNGNGRVFFNAISEPQMARASQSIRRHSVGVVHNGVDPRSFAFRDRKDDYFITLARFTFDKGQDIAARVCRQLGVPLRMAGTVGGIESPGQLAAELRDRFSPFHDYKDVKYYLEQVRPYETSEVTWEGSVGGERKKALLAGARGMLMPVRWEEPFGMAVIEALASGTPVIAFRRGAMPVIIEHGHNGFLADSEEELALWVKRVDEIDPRNCRRSVEERFSAAAMARGYVELYERISRRAS